MMLLQYLIGLHDSYFIITPYSLLHALTGYLIQRYSDHVAVPLVLILGWEVFEYWASRAIGYWTSRNAANTAADIAIGAIGYMGTFAPHYVAFLGLGLGIFLKVYPGETNNTNYSQMDTAKSDAILDTAKSDAILEMIRKWRHKCSWLRAQTLWEARKQQRALRGDTGAFNPEVAYLFFPDVLEPYQPPTRAHWTLAGACLLMCAWPRDAPNLLANLCIPFALTNPSRAQVLAQDNRTDAAITLAGATAAPVQSPP
jgi:hypothetical protein